jgi:hypothetical protein
MARILNLLTLPFLVLFLVHFTSGGSELSKFISSNLWILFVIFVAQLVWVITFIRIRKAQKAKGLKMDTLEIFSLIIGLAPLVLMVGFYVLLTIFLSFAFPSSPLTS